MSKFAVFSDIIITDSLQNLRFYQRSSKNANQKMLCTKNELLTNCTQGFITSIFFISADCCEA